MPVHTTSVGMERKLAAILSADVQGYSRLMGEDEEATVRTLTASREVTDSLIQQHRGRVVNTAGDSVLAEFASAVDAVQCAVEIQQTLGTRNTDLPAEHRMEFRIGINVGDVVVEGEQLYGDGVNVAARLQTLADAGGVFISGTVYDQVKNKLALNYETLGEHSVKNIADPVRVWRVRWKESDNQQVEDSASQKAKGKGQKSKIENRMATAHHVPWTKGAFVLLSILLLAGVIVGVQYVSFRLPAPSANIPPPQPSALPLPDKPSIAVLPFKNMSGDPEQEYFSDGITEDLTSDLSKVSSLFVIARNSAFTYKGKAVKVQDVSQDLGVRYVLEGSVRKADNQVRITAQLIDATTGGHLWSGRYDRPLQDIFALQDEIVQKIVTTLKLQLSLWERGILTRFSSTNNLEAYDYFLRGMEFWHRLTKETNAQARQMYEKAIALDPQYAEAYAGLGHTYWIEWLWQWGQNPQPLEQAFTLAQKAIAIDDSQPWSHMLLGQVYLLKKQHEQAITEAQRAVTLDPNYADSYAELAQVLTFAGRPEEAIGIMEKAMRLNPSYPFFYLFELGRAYRLLGRYEEAIAALKNSLARDPNFLSAHLQLAAAYSQSGREEEARAEAAEVLRIDPTFSLEGWGRIVPHKDQAIIEHTLAALRTAGLK